MMKSMLRSASLGLFVATVYVGGWAQAQNATSITAVVNNEVISVYDLEARISMTIATSQIADTPNSRRRMAPQILRNLIEEKIKLQEAKRLNIQVKLTDINLTLADIERRNKLQPGGLNSFLAQQGVDKAILIEQIQADIAWAKVVNQKLRSTIQIGEDEIDEALARIKADKGKPQHWVAEIFLPIDNPDQEKNVRAIAADVIEQLKSKAQFGTLAANFSQSASAAVGGDLGWVDRGQLGEKIDAVLAKMQPGQVSQPIRTVAGYHILMLRQRRAAPGLNGGKDNTTITLQQLVLPLSSGAGPEKVRGQTDLAKTMSELAASCQDMERLGKELNSPLSGSLGTMKLSRLPAEFRDIVRTLPINKAGPAVRRGNAVIVLMVCNRQGIEPKVDPREKARTILLRQRIDVASRRYLRKLRQAAFCESRLPAGAGLDPCK